MDSDIEDNSASLDDILEEERRSTDDIPIIPLPEDNNPPAADAESSKGTILPIDHPSTDSGLDSSELYDEGEEGIVDIPTHIE